LLDELHPHGRRLTPIGKPGDQCVNRGIAVEREAVGRDRRPRGACHDVQQRHTVSLGHGNRGHRLSRGRPQGRYDRHPQGMDQLGVFGVAAAQGGQKVRYGDERRAGCQRLGRRAENKCAVISGLFYRGFGAR